MSAAQKPLVSILCVTYNQEKYIGEALDSFLMQQTNFPFEILVHDDASTDTTADIIRTYAKKHPKIVKPIYEKTNQYSKGNDQFIKDMLIAAKGKYIAECEGDDFWTDPEKLQRQVDFMEEHPDYALCFHPVKVFFENGDAEDYIYPDPKEKQNFSVKELLKQNFIQSNSVMYRKQNYNDLPTGITPMDWFTHLYHARFGKIGFINRPMAAYRRHTAGMWWGTHENLDSIWIKHGIHHLVMYAELLKIYGNNKAYRDTLYMHIAKMFQNLIEVDKKHSTKTVNQAVWEKLDAIEPALVQQYEMIQARDRSLQVQEERIQELQQAITQKDWAIEQKSHEIASMKASKFWKSKVVYERGKTAVRHPKKVVQKVKMSARKPKSQKRSA